MNGCAVLPESIRHDHIDLLMIVVKKFRSMFNELPGLLKADVDSAFRRIPLRPNHRWAAGVAYKHDESVYVSIHNACPFGAVSLRRKVSFYLRLQLIFPVSEWPRWERSAAGEGKMIFE